MNSEPWGEAYRLLSCLKDGEDGKTFLLEETRGARRLICKSASGQGAELLRKEYETIQSLPPAYGFETLLFREEGDVCFLTRDYIPGQSLEELVESRGKLDPVRAAELCARLCGVLAPLHKSDPPVIHRDLKPENVVLTWAGELRLIDFETARTYKPGQETDTVRLGTRSYAAPEQYGYGQTDARTDVYALGRLLLYLLNGDCESALPPLRGRDRALGRIIARCCAYDPARRYAGAGELEAALRRFLARRARLSSWPRLAGAAALALTLCLLSVWGGYALGLRRAAAPAAPAAGKPSWDPFLCQEAVAGVVDAFLAEDQAAVDAALEALVGKLDESELLDTVEPIDWTKLDEAALNDYFASRSGYEFIADKLGYGGGLIRQYRGNYAAAIPSFMRQLALTVEYSQSDENGNAYVSALSQYLAQGERRNIDGCVIEILEALAYALEEVYR